MKYFKKIKIVLVIVPILCLMPLFTTYGQDSTTEEFTVMEIQDNLMEGNSDGTISTQLIVEVKYNGKLYQLIILSGMKLKYKLIDEKAVILFDESYFLPKEE